MTGEDKQHSPEAAEETERKEDLSGTWRGKLNDPMTLFTALVALFTFLLFVVAALQWRTLENTDETLRRTLEVNQRPWVAMDVKIAGAFVFGDTMSVIPLKVEIKNSGLSMAEDVRVFPVIYPSGIPHITGDEILDTRCRKPRTTTIHGMLTFALFPGQSSAQVYGLRLTDDDVKKLKESETPRISPSIVICVSYKASIADTIYFTSTFFGLSQRIAENSDLVKPINIKAAPIPAEMLYLMPLGSHAQ